MMSVSDRQYFKERIDGDGRGCGYWHIWIRVKQKFFVSFIIRFSYEYEVIEVLMDLSLAAGDVFSISESEYSDSISAV